MKKTFTATTPFNTPGMFHGWIKADDTIRVAIFEE